MTAIAAILFSYIAGLIPSPWQSENFVHSQDGGSLQIVASTFTHDGALDVKLLNPTDIACFITRIEVTCLEAHRAWVKAPVHPSAAYVIPVEGMHTGETRYVEVSFAVPPKSPDRILLYIDSSQLFTLRVALRYNSGQVISFTNKMWQFPAAPITDAEATNDIGHSRLEYVIWDGEEESPYAETGGVHDCVYLYDGMISCRDMRKEFLRLGFVHTMLFACGPGQTAVTFTNGGLFTQNLDAILKQNPKVTIRDAVRLANKSMRAQGYAQNCEVIARRDVLALPFLDSTIDGEKHALCLYDTCRTPIPESDKGVKWHRIKPGDFGPLSNQE